MLLRFLFCIFLGLSTTQIVGAKELAVTNMEALYKTSVRKYNGALYEVDIRIHNRSGSDDWYIHIPPPIETIHLYIKDKDGRLSAVKVDENTPHTDKKVKINGFMYPLSLLRGETKTYYLYIKSSYQLAVPLYIGTMEAIYEEDHFRNIINGFMLGMLVALMIYSLYIFIAIRDRTFLYYLGYVICSLIFLMTWNEYFTHWLPSWRLLLLSGSCALTLLFSVLFANRYLELPRSATGLYHIRRWIYAIFVIPFVVDLAGFTSLAFQLLCSTVAIAGAYWLVAGFCSLRHKVSAAAIYLIGVVLLLYCYAFYEGFHSSMNIQLGLCLQALGLIFAQSIHLNTLKKESIRLQKAMMDQAAGFSKRLITGQENEKENLARELNTSIGQQLVLLKNEVFVLRKRSSGQQTALFNGMTQDIGKAIEEVGQVSSSLHPYQLNTLGLKRSIIHMIEEVNASSDTVIALHIDELDELLPHESAINLYRVIQELLNNLIKHAQASQCSIRIKHTKDRLIFYYQDNGKGFDYKAVFIGLGLLGIRERCILLNAKTNLTSLPDQGTKILIKIPLQERNKRTQQQYYKQ
ncbi:MAG: 7TM diverse intracellular signaling domain-containing protein [Sphingobacterium sp.]